MTTLRIYAACLASYNAGHLHGVWIDATLGVDHIEEEIQKMLKASKEPYAEEWAIHDYEDMLPQGEYPDLERIAKFAEFLDEGDPERWAYIYLFDGEALHFLASVNPLLSLYLKCVLPQRDRYIDLHVSRSIYVRNLYTHLDSNI